MLKDILKHSKEFVEKYEQEGAKMLQNCDDYMEYNKLLEQLKRFELENLQLRGNGVSDCFKRAKISYFNIVEEDSRSIGVFCLAKGAYAITFCFCLLNTFVFLGS